MTDANPPDGNGPWSLWARKAPGGPLRCHGVFSDYDRASSASEDLVMVQGYAEAVVKDANLLAVFTHQERRP